MVAYHFKDYWKDVGTIDSLWEANLDLLDPKTRFDLSDPDWRIYSRSQGMPPQYVDRQAKVENSLVTDGCEIYGEVDFSVLFENVTVEPGARVKYSLIMPGATIAKDAVVQYAVVAENVRVEAGAVIGESPESCDDIAKWGIAVVGEGLTVGENARVGAKCMVTESVAPGTEVAL